MKIKHKQTGDEVELTYGEWEGEYLTRRLNESYDILDQDIVMVRLVRENGQRENFKKFDRNHALAMLKSNPKHYDFIDIYGGKIENGKRVEVENPRFEVLKDKWPIRWWKAVKRNFIRIIVGGLAGLLTYFLIKMIELKK